MNIEKELKKIVDRNHAVEADKAWEVSLTRRLMLMAFIYLMVVLVLWIVKVDAMWLGAIVPAVGYFLSTLSISPFKKFWIKHRYK